MVLLCFGYGYVARALAGRLAVPVLCTTRDGREGSMRYHDGQVGPQLAGALAQATHLLISIPPHAGEAMLLEAIQRLAKRRRWIGYLSSTGVYGDHQGQVVDEASALLGESPGQLARRQSERLWQAIGAHVFRLSGIYGPGRSVLNHLRDGTVQRIDKPGHRFCRIHVRDIARALAASMQAPMVGEVFNLADDLPAPQAEVVRYASGLLGMKAPPLIPYARATLSPALRGFYAASRQVSSEKIKRCYGLSWEYPTYRHGLAAILQDEWME